MFLRVDGGRSQITSFSNSTRPTVDIFYIDDGSSWISSSTRWWLLLDPLAVPPRGGTIDVFFNIGGGRCWTRRQHPKGPPSTSSSTSVMAAVGPIDNAP
jgi:hypothetical protein